MQRYVACFCLLALPVAFPEAHGEKRLPSYWPAPITVLFAVVGAQVNLVFPLRLEFFLAWARAFHPRLSLTSAVFYAFEVEPPKDAPKNAPSGSKSQFL